MLTPDEIYFNCEKLFLKVILFLTTIPPIGKLRG